MNVRGETRGGEKETKEGKEAKERGEGGKERVKVWDQPRWDSRRAGPRQRLVGKPSAVDMDDHVDNEGVGGWIRKAQGQEGCDGGSVDEAVLGSWTDPCLLGC